MGLSDVGDRLPGLDEAVRQVAGDLSLNQIRITNQNRCMLWHPTFMDPDDSWTIADWSNAAAGEMGELCNVVKKLRRQQTGLRGNQDASYTDLMMEAAKETADTILYLDLLAAKLGFALGPAISVKFNEVSRREGFPQRLELQ